MTETKQGPVKIIIFDCDGVMFDTINSNKAYYNDILHNFAFPDLTDDQFKYVHSHTCEESLAFLFNKSGLLPHAIAYHNQINYTKYIDHMVIEPDLKPLLIYLEKNQIKRAIATNRTDTMPLVMKTFGLNPYFDVVITALDTKNPKPAPDAIYQILDQWHLLPQDALYIGDSKVDEMTAQNSGVPFIAYQNLSLQADYHINRLKEIIAIIS